jgi:hypothetical protein
MGLTEVQCLLARLYTDAETRERYFADPRAMSEAYGLSTVETKQMCRLSPEHVRFFAGSLKRKRLKAVASLLPRSSRALGQRFVEPFSQFADTFIPDGANRAHQDAEAFASFLEALLRKEHAAPPWVVELLRYEAAEVTAALKHCVIRWFREPIGRILQPLAIEGRSPMQPSGRTLVIWWRISRQHQARRVTLSLPQLGFDLASFRG